MLPLFRGDAGLTYSGEGARVRRLASEARPQIDQRRWTRQRNYDDEMAKGYAA